MTDVNIAVHMITDAIYNNCGRFVIVSGDSDLVPAVRTVKTLTKNKTVIVYVPARNKIRGATGELRKASDKHRTLPNAVYVCRDAKSCVSTKSKYKYTVIQWIGKINYELSKEYVFEDQYEEVMHRGKPKIGDLLFTT